jgi:DNA-binding transcriptional LysR family regulator
MIMADINFLDAKMLECFRAAAQELHFGRAAAKVFMSQPPFSQQIKRLEETVGTPLFERTTRSVRLTPAGSVMARHATALAADTAAMLRAVRRAAHGESGPLKVGLAPTAAYSPLADGLYRYRAAYPDVELDIHEANSNSMEDLLRGHHIDVAIMRPMSLDESIETTEVCREPMMLVLRQDHPWARRPQVTLAQAATLPLVDYSQAASPYFRQLLHEMFARIDVQPQFIRESVIPTLLTLVEIGIGAAIVPLSLSRMRAAPLVFIPVRDAVRARIVAAVLRGSWHASARGFITHLRAPLHRRRSPAQ